MPADNGPDRGQQLAAAGGWRADGTQREPEMRIEVRGGAIRCFSAPHRPICFSPSLALRQPPGRCAALLCAPDLEGALHLLVREDSLADLRIAKKKKLKNH